MPLRTSLCSDRHRGAASHCLRVPVPPRAALYQRRLADTMDKEPVYKKVYLCSKQKCNGWRFKGVADANGESKCIKCNSQFSTELGYKAVSQKTREGQGSRPVGGNPWRGGKTSAGGGGDT